MTHARPQLAVGTRQSFVAAAVLSGGMFMAAHRRGCTRAAGGVAAVLASWACTAAVAQPPPPPPPGSSSSSAPAAERGGGSGSWDSGVDVEWESLPAATDGGGGGAPATGVVAEGEERLLWLAALLVALLLAALCAVLLLKPGKQPRRLVSDAQPWAPSDGRPSDMDDHVSEVSSFIEARDAVQRRGGGSSGGAMSPLVSLRSHDPLSRDSDSGAV